MMRARTSIKRMHDAARTAYIMHSFYYAMQDFASFIRFSVFRQRLFDLYDAVFLYGDLHPGLDVIEEFVAEIVDDGH